MKTQIEIYGVITKITAVSAHDVIINVKEEGTNKVWEVLLANDMRLHFDLEEGVHVYARGEKALGGIFAEYVDEWGRICSHCGKHHTEGYYSENTGLYACSDECLEHLYTEAEIMEEREQELLFWTEWE